MKIAVYPGTFDPVTNGHIDILNRAIAVFDKVIIAVATDNYKNTLFTLDERLAMLQEIAGNLPNVEVDIFKGLLVEYCKGVNANAIVRGLRAVSDFEYELQIALMNKKLNDNLETVFLMTAAENSFVSSTIIKQVSVLGGCIQGLVPDFVAKKLNDKYTTSGDC
jgi:pantetheine-phosphate adenylyltransferase